METTIVLESSFLLCEFGKNHSGMETVENDPLLAGIVVWKEP